MKQVIVELDDATAALLERVAPARNHKRSEFVRRAIVRALLSATEANTRRAYAEIPDEPASFDAREWAAERDAVRPKRRRK